MSSIAMGQDEGLRDLFADALADGQTVVRSEIAYYKATAKAEVDRVTTPAILGIAAIMMVQASLTTLLVGIGFALAFWLGPLGGAVAATAIGLAVAGLLVWIALRRFKAGAVPPATSLSAGVRP